MVIYCAAGNRSAFAAETLEQLGFEDVVSMAGGFGRWKNEGRDWQTPKLLNPEQRNRYGRHILLPEVGEAGQQKLLESRVLLLGAGGLGSPAALYLAAAGVGTLGIVDMDVVDASNLQRQILHNMDRIGERKVDSAKKTLTDLNPDVDVVTYDVRFGADNVLDILDGYDVVVDGTDNFPTRYLLNDASLLERIPVVHGSIFRFEGQVTVFDPYNGPCYRCLLPEPPPAELAPSCAEAGVLGVLPGIIGSIQALEAIKLLLDLGDPLRRPPARVRRARGVVPLVQGAARPELPGLRRERRRDRHRRVRRALPPPRGAGRREHHRALTRLSRQSSIGSSRDRVDERVLLDVGLGRAQRSDDERDHHQRRDRRPDDVADLDPPQQAAGEGHAGREEHDPDGPPDGGAPVVLERDQRLRDRHREHQQRCAHREQEHVERGELERRTEEGAHRPRAEQRGPDDRDDADGDDREHEPLEAGAERGVLAHAPLPRQLREQRRLHGLEEVERHPREQQPGEEAPGGVVLGVGGEELHDDRPRVRRARARTPSRTGAVRCCG